MPAAASPPPPPPPPLQASDPGPGPPLTEPLAPATAAALRRAVLELATSERRRRFPVLVHVGTPGAAVALHPADEPSDHGLRTDVLAAMVAWVARRAGRDGYGRGDRDGRGVPLVWLTRPGELVPQDVDLAWLAAARAAYAEAGLPLTFVVVGRHGWRDPRSGVSRHWVRLRRR